jgi:uncharacterized protein YajQ (UPF0234 family)
MPSFDVVSELNWAEVENALIQAQKEISQRYDFRGTDASIERTDEGLVVTANVEDRVRAALTVLEEKLVRRKVSLLFFAPQEPVPGAKNTKKIVMKVAEGIERDKAKQIIQIVKDSKIKVQASIQDEMVRVSGKKKDDLQAAMSLLRSADIGIELQYKNFRD